MSRLSRIRSLLVLALAALLLSTAPAGADHSSWQGTFDQFTFDNGVNTRKYWVYVPPNLPPGPRPLFVYLHGCTQTGDDAARGIRLNQLADIKGFVVVYPEQNVDQSPGQTQGNGIRCWNWFYPDRAQRGVWEPSTISGITQRLMDPSSVHGLEIDAARVFIFGASAGGDMAVIMGATYPDLYAAIGPLAACAFATCVDTKGIAAYMAMGAYARMMPVMVVNGSADPLNNVAMAQGLVHQWLGTNDLVDDGMLNSSISNIPETELRTADPGDGNGYVYTIDHYLDGNECELINFYLVQGLAHNYPHGDPHGTYTDPKGPDVTAAYYQFFMDHPMPPPGRGDSCHPPVAQDDLATTTAGAPVEIDVLGNDTDLDGDVLSVESVTDPANGTVVNNGGSVTYTPDPGFVGNVSFNYTVTGGDGNGGTDIAEVSVSVNDAIRPRCSVSSRVTGQSITLKIQDLESGLSHVQVLDPVNTAPVVDAFDPGTSAPVYVTASRQNSSERSRFRLSIADQAGNGTSCTSSGWISF